MELKLLFQGEEEPLLWNLSTVPQDDQNDLDPKRFIFRFFPKKKARISLSEEQFLQIITNAILGNIYLLSFFTALKILTEEDKVIFQVSNAIMVNRDGMMNRGINVLQKIFNGSPDSSALAALNLFVIRGDIQQSFPLEAFSKDCFQEIETMYQEEPSLLSSETLKTIQSFGYREFATSPQIDCIFNYGKAHAAFNYDLSSVNLHFVIFQECQQSFSRLPGGSSISYDLVAYFMIARAIHRNILCFLRDGQDLGIKQWVNHAGEFFDETLYLMWRISGELLLGLRYPKLNPLQFSLDEILDDDPGKEIASQMLERIQKPFTENVQSYPGLTFMDLDYQLDLASMDWDYFTAALENRF